MNFKTHSHPPLSLPRILKADELHPSHHDSLPMNDTPSEPNSEADLESPPIPDPRIISALDDLDYPYEVNPKTGDFHVRYNFDDERAQMVSISSTTEEFMGIELRDIYSTSILSEGIFDARTANLLLRENSGMKFGNWRVEVGAENRHYAVFCMTVSAALPHRALAEIMDMVARTSDEMESRLSGLDDF